MVAKVRYILTLIFCLVAFIGECANIEMEVLEGCSAVVSRKVGKSKEFWKYAGEGTKMELISNEGRYSMVLLGGDTCYVHSDIISYSRTADSSTLKGWMNQGEDKSFWNGGGNMSTDRIMEMLPSFNILEGKVHGAQYSFWIAVCSLLVGGIILLIPKPIRCGNILYWLLICASLTASVAEVIYLLTSPDPLGFCDINNHGLMRSIFRIGLCGLALYIQLALFSTVLFVTQCDLDFDFKGGMGPKIMLLTTLYFIVYVIAFHFFGERLPMWLNLIFAGANLIPIAMMLIRAFINMNFKPLIILVPYYIIAGSAILFIYCIVGISVAVIAFILLLLKFFMSGNDIMYVKKNGVWYYCDYDTWFQGRDMGVWDDWSSNFSTWMVK